MSKFTSIADFSVQPGGTPTVPNLHLLAGQENRSKQHQSLVAGLGQRAEETKLGEVEFRLRSHIPVSVFLELRDFRVFFDLRKEELKTPLAPQSVVTG